jgi:hypothetical protein
MFPCWWRTAESLRSGGRDEVASLAPAWTPGDRICVPKRTESSDRFEHHGDVNPLDCACAHFDARGIPCEFELL